MKIAVILGTRPEIIKLEPVIHQLQKEKINFFIIHTKQHYSSLMDQILIEELLINKPKYDLAVGSGNHGAQTGKMLGSIEEILLREKSDIVLVQGDTNTTLGAALAAAKIAKIKIAHIEAGLRSFDRTMPEEINRVIADHLSDLLFVPTKLEKTILIKEGIDKKKIFITGNTISDAVRFNFKKAIKKSKILKKLGLIPKKFFVVTLHRASNVDDPKKLKKALSILNKISMFYQVSVVFPVHPRTKKIIEKNKIKIPKSFLLTDPLSFFDFLILESSSKLIFTDSGGVQEEALILKVPCLTIRENTERPQTIKAGANMLVDLNYREISMAINKILNKKINYKNPFGINVAKKIVTILKKNYK